MIGTLPAIAGLGAGVRFDVPVDPEAPEAQQWLREELAKAPYQAARPTWFDRLSQSFLDWLGSLTAGGGDGFGDWIPLIVTVLAVAAVAVLFLIFGMPRLNRRRRRPAGVLGEHDTRSADDLRRAARLAAASGDWNRAVQEMYRAIARGLDERTLLRALPGTTAHAIATRAGAVFPAEAERLEHAARAFDAVRYLGRDASEGDFGAVAELERALREASPVTPAGRL